MGIGGSLLYTGMYGASPVEVYRQLKMRIEFGQEHDPMKHCLLDTIFLFRP